MNYSVRVKNFDLPAFGKNWGMFFVWGLLLSLLGIFAIYASNLTTIVSVVFLGILILIGGIIMTIDAFTFWMNKGWPFITHLLMGILYLFVGIMVINNPVVASVSLTLLLGIFYLVLGVLRIVYSSSAQLPRWGWTCFNGMITLLLGILILSSWPSSSLFIIGLFVGIDLLFTGWAYIMGSLAARSLANNVK